MLSHVFCDLNNIFNNLINILKLRRITMTPEDEAFWQAIDDHILDAIQLIRLKWSNFNSIPMVDKIVANLHTAYKASGHAADAMDKGWIQ